MLKVFITIIRINHEYKHVNKEVHMSICIIMGLKGASWKCKCHTCIRCTFACATGRRDPARMVSIIMTRMPMTLATRMIVKLLVSNNTHSKNK